MKKKDIFFVCIFTVSFLMCTVVITGDYLCKQLERSHLGNGVTTWEFWPYMTEGRQEEHEDNKEEFAEVQEGQQEAEKHSENHSEAEEDQPIEETVKGPLTFETAGYEYFEDALFIGDSRTVGLMEYGNIENATFFADSGMSVFGLEQKKISVSGKGKKSLDEVLEEKAYGKIYLMLGINELGYRFDALQSKYQAIVEKLRMQQKDAIIYLCANMHVTKEQSDKDAIYNNENVNRVNEMISGLADNETMFYIDVNELFDDEAGNLSKEYSSDSFHVYGKYYMDWVDWLCTKAITIPENS